MIKAKFPQLFIRDIRTNKTNFRLSIPISFEAFIPYKLPTVNFYQLSEVYISETLTKVSPFLSKNQFDELVQKSKQSNDIEIETFYSIEEIELFLSISKDIQFERLEFGATIYKWGGWYR